MNGLKNVALILLRILAALLIIISLLSLLYDNLGAWWIRSLNFPREQLLVMAILFLGLFLPFNLRRSGLNKVLLNGLLVSAGIHLWFILPYTFIWEKEVPAVDQQQVAPEATVALLIANVYMKNRNVSALVDIIKSRKPDLVFLMETNRWWVQALQGQMQEYRYTVAYPLDNTYGLVLYSKLPLQNTEIKFLDEDSVPSVHTLVKMPNQRTFHFHGIHPVPPIPSKYPDNVGESAEALQNLARIVLRQEGPVVVAGDFNDVAWSETNRVFREESKLKDVRTGRGFYNSFNVKSVFIRWPLDHFFVSPHFSLLELDRLPAFGSDHFPVSAKLVLPAGAF